MEKTKSQSGHSRRGRRALDYKVNMVYVRINDKELGLLDELAKRTFTTRSSCLRRALHEILSREGLSQEEL